MGRFEPSPPKGKPPAAYPYTATISAPTHAVAGSTLHYDVRLGFQNNSWRGWDPSHCPSYSEVLANSKGVTLAGSTYVLNCAPAASVGRSGVTFAMGLHLPESLAPGKDTLTWTLSPDSCRVWNDLCSTDTASITVSSP